MKTQWRTERNGRTGEVYSWASIIEQGAVEQINALSRLPIVHGHVAVMPDVHQGVGGAGTVGTAFVTEGALVPAALGPDLGCGMVAVKLNVTTEEIRPYLGEIRGAIVEQIPMGVGKQHEAGQQSYENFEMVFGPPPSKPHLRDLASRQFATLGSGNHFIEVSADQDGWVWAVVHSGSRGIGFKLAESAMYNAKLLCGNPTKDYYDTGKIKHLNWDGVEKAYGIEHPDLSYLFTTTESAQQYILDMFWAQQYAKAQRGEMMNRVLAAIDMFVPADTMDHIDCHHNYAEVLQYGDDSSADLWLCRKGAINAEPGVRGIIPGSMGDTTYLVEGNATADSWWTAPHGAGRVLGRGEARKVLLVDDLRDRMQERGTLWDDRSADRVIDEAPGAYKAIETVMIDSEELVIPTHELRAIINCKGI